MPQKQRAGSLEKPKFLAEVQEVAALGWKWGDQSAVTPVWMGGCCGRGGDAAVPLCFRQWDFGVLPMGCSRELSLCGDNVWRHPCISHKAADGGTRPQRLLSLFLRCLSLPNYVSERFPFDANHPGGALQNNPERDTPSRTVCPRLGEMSLLVELSESQHICPAVPGAALGSIPSPVLWDNR